MTTNDSSRDAPPARLSNVTARDVGRLLGVSQSTVSRAFNPNAPVAQQTRERIIKAANDFGYRPNAMARSLITRRSNIVGIVIANLINPFYPETIEQFSLRLQDVGLQSLLFNVPPSKKVEDELPQLLQYQIDALILISSTISPAMAERCVTEGRPVILFNLYVPGQDIPSICCDNLGGGQLIADYLVESGHRRIAFAAGRAGSTTNDDRERGFVSRLEALGIPLLARTGGNSYTYEAGCAAARTLVASKPDAIFFVNDLMAMGGIDTLRHEYGLRIPEDISVIGFDDVPMASWRAYDLTTVHRPIPEMVDLAVGLLDGRIMGHPMSSQPQVVPVQLIERQSSRRR
jgi:DNA-binding LacI/PurR family transcriptional regulator